MSKQHEKSCVAAPIPTSWFSGEAPPGRSAGAAERDARGLLALVEGLLLQLARRDRGPADAAAVLERFVSGIFAAAGWAGHGAAISRRWPIHSGRDHIAARPVS
ncbi:hypothetical protein [Nocardia grenadensis]